MIHIAGLSYKNEYRGMWLADPVSRILAIIIDGIFLTTASFFMLLMLELFRKFVDVDFPDFFSSGPAGVILGFIFFGIPPVFQLYLIETRGQSVGKLIMKIRIVHWNGGKPSSDRLFFMRYFLPLVILTLPIAGWGFFIFDFVHLFNEDRRTLHDRMAAKFLKDH